MGGRHLHPDHRLRYKGAASCFLALFILSAPNALALEVMGGAPAGFENLEAPRASMVMLSQGGTLLGSFPAHITPSTISFDKPQAIVDTLAALKDKPRIASLLARPLPANTGRTCGTKAAEDCGTLNPDIVGVIFNPDRLEAELFINAAYLDVVDNSGAHYLPLPDRQFSSVYGFNGAVAGSTQDTTNFSVSNNVVLAFGEGRSNINTTASDNGLRFNTADIGVERNGWAAFGGLLRTQAMQMTPDRDIAGVSIASSTRTLVDNYRNEGNDIVLFLPRRAYVSIYREGQLYSSRAYEAGNQKVDTSDLPEGAYDITLKIQEADGNLREERRLFAKSPDLPSPDMPTYYLQGGVLRARANADSTIPQLSSDPIIRAGTNRRITDKLGLTIGTLGLNDRGAVESGLFYLDSGLQLRATTLVSTRGDYGLQQSTIYVGDRWNAALDLRRIWAADQHTDKMASDTFFWDTTQGTLSFGYQASTDVLLGLRASYAAFTRRAASTSIGPYAQWQIWQQGESELSLSADAARVERHSQGAMLLRYTRQLGSYGYSATGGASYGRAGANPYTSARVWHEDRSPDSTLLLGGGVQGDPRGQSVNADADWRNRVGRVRGGIQQAVGNNNVTTYGGSFSVNAAQLQDDMTLGGSDNDRSAVIIDTEGSATADLRIFVNGAEVGSVKVGSKQTLYLAPFHTYSIRVMERSQQLLDIDSSVKRVTLYPGNVVKLNWHVDPVFVVTGRLVDSNGTPLNEAKLQGSRDLAATNAQGRFQAEVKQPTTLTFVTETGTCRAILPQQMPVNNVLAYRQPLVCQLITESAAR